MAQLLWAGDSQHYTRPDEQTGNKIQTCSGPVRAQLASALIGRHYDGGKMSGWGGAIWSERTCTCPAERGQWPWRWRVVESASGGRAVSLNGLVALPSATRAARRNATQARKRPPSPDRFRPGETSSGLNHTGKARHGGRDNRTRGDDSCFAGPRRGGRVGNEQATGEPVSDDGPARQQPGYNTVTRLIYRISCRHGGRREAYTQERFHIACCPSLEFPRAGCTCLLAN